MNNDRPSWGCLPRTCNACCGIMTRMLLLAVLIVNLAVSSVLISRFTTVNGITIQNSSPPPAIILSEVVAALSAVYILVSFCFLRLPVLLLVGDMIFFVAWSAATLVFGFALNQTLRFNCSVLAIELSSGLGYSTYSAATISQQIFDSCNISKTLFSFHVIAAVFFIGVAISAGISLSLGNHRNDRGQRRTQQVNQQQNNYYRGGPSSYQTRGGMQGAPAPFVPEIVV